MQELAYCGLGVADIAGWERFAVEALGLVADRSDGTCRLRMDDCSWRVALHASDADDILYAGFEVEGESELRALQRKIADAGIGWTDLSESECSQRQVGGGFWVNDPDGLRIELVHDLEQAATPFESDNTQGFVTGEQGLGHIVLSVSDLDAGTQFYETIGLSLSDFISVPFGPDKKLRIAFMHCNPRHHSLAIAQLPSPKRLNHVMIELKEVDDVIRGHQRCAEMGYQSGSIGRHPNDLMLSFYVASPAGFDVEYGWGARHIEDDWSVREYDQISIWGHERAETAGV